MRHRLVIAAAVLVVLAVGWLVLDRTVLHDRRLGKDAAVTHCLADLHDDAQRRVHSDAQFGEPTVMQTVVSGLESHNTFLCTALVFDDNSVETFARQIFP